MAKRNLNINLAGRVKKVQANNFLVALYEAISNSIHAIEDRKNVTGTITVEILRNPRQQSLAILEEKPISGFKITDNGIGFNKRNMDSFGESDSTFKASKGGKGVGRFSWLKFFEKVEISSSFSEDGTMMRRDFEFTLSGIEETKCTPLLNRSSYETSVLLSPIFPHFEDKSRKSLDDLAIALVEHFITYLVTDSLPTVTLLDGAAQRNLHQFYKESIGRTSKVKHFVIKSTSFQAVAIRNYFTHSKHTVFLCGHKRVADRTSLSELDEFLSRTFYDSSLKRYAYYVFIESSYLDSIVNDDREGFRFPEPDSLYASTDDTITKNMILKEALKIVHEELSEEIDKKKKENIETVENFVVRSAPQYRYILKNHQNKIETIHDTDPVKIDLALRRIQFEQEAKTKVELANLMRDAEEQTSVSKTEWQTRSKEVIAMLSENGKASLAGYIVQRKLILDLLKKRLEIEGDKFAREEAIHELIFPMRTTSDEVSYEDQNLWIIDERLAYHYYLASDKPLSTIPSSGTQSSKEPDIIVFNRPIALNNRPENERAESIVIIEFKRPGESAVRGDKNPVDQILEYIELIQDGRAENRKGRKIEVSGATYFFGYVICEIDSNLKKVLSRKTMRQTPDERGMFGYFESHKAYIEVIGYDKMLDDAFKRNHILFNKLQIPPGNC